jgi:flagellar basal-body rod modification protein FlgD
MTSINATGVNPDPNTQVPGAASGSALGKDDFLKMLVAQLQNQDPMSPMKDMEFIGQMASFSSLEQINNLAAANDRMADNLSSSTAIGLIGKTVSWVDENDQVQTGVVEKVSTAGGTPTLTVSGHEGVDLSVITQVA